MPRPRAKASRILLGIPELDRRLEELELAIANRVARSALSKGARLAAKKIKAAVPGEHKGVRRAIGSSVKKQKSGRNKGWTEAKAGGAVGKKVSKQEQEAKQAKAGRTNKGGVGISSANVHWYLAGTAERRRKRINPGQSSGKMPAHNVIRRAMSTGSGAVLKAIKDGVDQGIEREATKIAAKHKLTNVH